VLTEHGVQVAPRTYRNWKTAAPSARTVTDARLTDALRATVDTPEGMYGRRKMTAYLRRQGHRVAGCTVDNPSHGANSDARIITPMSPGTLGVTHQRVG
jgi:hypothetical protein